MLFDVADSSDEDTLQNVGQDKQGNKYTLENVDQDKQENPLFDFLYPSKDLLPDDKEMSIFDHLEELRQRIFVSVLAVGAAMLGCFAFSKELIMVLEAPVKAQGVRFLQLAPGEFFFTTLKVERCIKCPSYLGDHIIYFCQYQMELFTYQKNWRVFTLPLVCVKYTTDSF